MRDDRYYENGWDPTKDQDEKPPLDPSVLSPHLRVLRVLILHRYQNLAVILRRKGRLRTLSLD
jgi:hypothetical protein